MFLDWVILNEFQDQMDRVQLKGSAADKTIQAIHPLEDTGLGIYFQHRGKFTKNHDQWRVVLSVRDPQKTDYYMAMGEQMPLLVKTLTAALAKFLLQVKPSALDVGDVFTKITQWGANQPDEIQSRLTTTAEIAVKRALSLASKNGQQYLKMGTELVTPEANRESLVKGTTHSGTNARTNLPSSRESDAKDHDLLVGISKDAGRENRRERMAAAQQANDMAAQYGYRPKAQPQPQAEPASPAPAPAQDLADIPRATKPRLIDLQPVPQSPVAGFGNWIRKKLGRA